MALVVLREVRVDGSGEDSVVVVEDENGRGEEDYGDDGLDGRPDLFGFCR